MDGLHISLVVLSGVVSCSHNSISGSVLDKIVRPGDNITLYCDCKFSSGVYIVWYRNCSHENQPSLVLKVKHLLFMVFDPLKFFPRFQCVRNNSSNSYDLLITNITDSDEGLYYCGTEEPRVEDKEYITQRYLYTYGNIATRIIFNSSSKSVSNPVSSVPWLMVFTPAFTILSSFISFILVFPLLSENRKPTMTSSPSDTAELSMQTD